MCAINIYINFNNTTLENADTFLLAKQITSLGLPNIQVTLFYLDELYSATTIYDDGQ